MTFRIEAIPDVQNAKSRSYRVFRDNVFLGFLEKYRNTQTETHPWKAFAPRFVPGQHPQFGTYLGAFYAGKNAAIAALDKA